MRRMKRIPGRGRAQVPGRNGARGGRRLRRIGRNPPVGWRSFGLPFLSLLSLALSSCAPEPLDPARYPLIPLPEEVEPGTGSFVLNGGTRIVVGEEGGSELLAVVERWARDVRAALDLPLPLTRASEADGPGTGGNTTGLVRIHLRREDDDSSPLLSPGEGLPGTEAEGYELDVGPRRVALEASELPGIFYGLETLGQLIQAGKEATGGGISLAAVEIDDEPRFRYRGMHLDVGRHFFPVSFIKRYLDLLAAYKMNVFHWHLTEDQGWRIEIQAYPRLTEVGSCRAETILEKNFDPYVGDGIPYCGFYTQDEIREVVAYARERFITVLPEIEMPGHSVAALAAYPELGCTPGPFQVRTRWGVTQDIYCPSEETFRFLEGVLSEVMELFPSPYIHIGGDEAPKTAWEQSELAQEVILREGLADEHELQSWFIRRIEAFLNANDRNLVGWDEILEGGLAPNATVMSWRGMDGGVEAARQGQDVIMTPTSHVYLDYYQGDTLQEPLAIGGFTPLERVYAFEPVPPELGRSERGRVLGAQGNVWTEYMATAEHVEYMVLPRMLALSEVVWSAPDSRDLEGFFRRLPAHLTHLDWMGANYRIPDVYGLEVDRLTLEDSLLVALSAPIGNGAIRFTLDGTEPGDGSSLYESAFFLPVDEAGVEVAARVVLSDGRKGPVQRATLRRAHLAPPVSLPASGRVPGLAGTVVPGVFPSIDSIFAGEGASPTEPNQAVDSVRFGPPFSVQTPRVSLPDERPRESFAVVLTGFIRVPRNGIYTFFLSSDDGSSLRVGGELVVDNDGYHSMSEKRGQAALHRGWHPLEVRYFQGGGSAEMRLEVQGPGITRRVVPAFWLAHSPDEYGTPSGDGGRRGTRPGGPDSSSQPRP